MVYELPKLEDVISDDPFLNKSISVCQSHSNEFYECLSATESAIRETVVSGKEYNTRVKSLSDALEDAAAVLPLHATALEKFSSGLSRIETYREMLITQTEVLTLEPLVDVRKELEQLKEVSGRIRKGDELLSLQTERYCAVRPIVQDEQHTLVTYPKSCIDTVRLREEHAYDKLQYVGKLRRSLRTSQLKYVQKMLEQMLAQFSYANFAYVVMSEMEPYLSDLFVELQTLQKQATEDNEADTTALGRTREQISETFEEQITVMKDTYPGADTEMKNSTFKSLLSFAVPVESVLQHLSVLTSSDSQFGAKGGKLDYLTNKRDSFLSYLNTDQQGSPKPTEPFTVIPTKSDYSPEEKEDSDNDTSDNQAVTTDNQAVTTDNQAVTIARRNPFDNAPPDIGDDLPIGEGGFVEGADTCPAEKLQSSQSLENLPSLCDDLLAVSDVKRSVSDVNLVQMEAEEATAETNSPQTAVQARKNKRRHKLTKVDSLIKLRNQNKTSGYLYVRQKSALGHKWILMYCVIEKDWLKCLVSDNELLELEHLPTTTVKPVGLEVERNSCFYLVSPKGKRCYQALTELDRRKWMQSLTQSSINALQRANSLTHGEHAARMHAIPGNRSCADCAAPNPEWACIDHGTTICIDCSGVHRSMGVNISKVRSLLLDNWTEEIVCELEEKGNTKFNEVYECCVSDKISSRSTRQERSDFIKKKYIEKAFHKEQSGDSNNS